MLRQTIAMSFLSNHLHASTIPGASGSQSPAPPSSVPVPVSRTMISSASPRFSKNMLTLNHSSSPGCQLCSSSHLEQEDGFVGTESNVAPEPLWILVFSGGTAFNGVVEDLKKFTTRVTHVLPVSDDGGSTAEIVRVLGGPAVGDIRSRCLRLSDESSIEALAVKKLLGHRLPLDSQKAKAEWYTIVEGENYLWEGVSGPYRETIRAFLVYFQSQILSHSNAKFCFSNGSIGNFFFAGARLFFQSLEAAIFLFSRVSQIPKDSCVLPVICTNDRLTLGCELMDGTIIRGQNEISHPHTTSSERTQQCVDKVMEPSSILPAPVKRIFYMSSEGMNLLHEVFPAVNPTVLEHLKQVNAIVYGMGSLFTSICPSLVLSGVGEVIAQRSCLKILILNGTHDRETFGMSASDFVISLCDALNRKYGKPEKGLDYPATSYVNCILVPHGGSVQLDLDRVHALGVKNVITVDSAVDERGRTIYEPKALIMALARLMD